MKRTLCIIVLLAISLSCFACAKPAAPVISADRMGVHSQKTTPEPTAEPTAEPTQEPTAEPTAEPVFVPSGDPEPISLPEPDFVIDDSAQYTMPWEKSPDEYTQATIEMPCNLEELTESNEHILGIDPFEISFALPTGWSIKDEPDENGLMHMFERWPLIYSKQYIYDETGRCMGAFAYSGFNELEYNALWEIYGDLSFGCNYNFQYQLQYIPITDLDDTVTALTSVYYSSSLLWDYPNAEMRNEPGRFNLGLLSHNTEKYVYVAFEFDINHITEEQYMAIAQSLRFN